MYWFAAECPGVPALQQPTRGASNSNTTTTQPNTDRDTIRTTTGCATKEQQLSHGHAQGKEKSIGSGPCKSDLDADLLGRVRAGPDP
jgi:hypothetical protein